MKYSYAERIEAVESFMKISGVRVGKITGIDKEGKVFVDFSDNPSGPIIARLTSSMKQILAQQDQSAELQVLLAFENNNPELPIIIDTLSVSVDNNSESSSINLEMDGHKDVLIDGKRMICL